MPADPLSRRIALARAAVGVERLLPALWPAVGFAGLYIAAALFGLFKYIPWEAQSLALAAAVTAVALALYQGFAQFAWPGRFEGARRLERDSGLLHRPISERDDILPDARDPFTAALWAAHRDRMMKLGALRVAVPQADLQAKDPHRLRYGVLALLVVGAIVARGDFGHRLLGAFDSGNVATIDAWIEPPAYTGLPLTPVTLTDRMVAVPAGSVLNLRVHGAAHAPGLSAGLNATRPFQGGDGDYAVTFPIRHNAPVRVRASGHLIADWRFTAIADAAPQIAFVGIPKRTEHDAVNFHFKGADDYGVTGVSVILVPHGRPHAPAVTVPLEGGGKTFDQTTYVDLTANPYAGLSVDARLEARDGAGNKTLSAPVTFPLPARIFTDPLARALIEQRQNLHAAALPVERNAVATMLDAFAIAPEKFYEGKRTTYLALRAAYFGIRTARAPSDIAHVEDLLWQTAVALERGGLLNAAEELRRIKALLSQAFASGAPQDQIDALMQRYNEAMQKYLEMMAQNPPDPSMQLPDNPDAVTLGENDIQKMMDLIKQLSAAGQREQAAQMLSMLQNMLENLRMSPGKGGGTGTAQNKALNDAMNKMGEAMGKQRSLLDKTFRQQQGKGDPKDGGAQGLAKQQQQLQQQMQDAMKGADGQAQQKMKDAAQAMQQSQDALQKGDLDNARNAQQKALQAMSQAAQQMADQARKDGGQAGNDKGDPLGRSQADQGRSVKIPDADTLAKARAILEELRKRAGEMRRPQEERDYIDRLLKSF